MGDGHRETLFPCIFCGEEAFLGRASARPGWLHDKCAEKAVEVHQTAKERIVELSGLVERRDARVEEQAEEIGKLNYALVALEKAESDYRFTYEMRGGGDIRTVRAWDVLRKAGDQARATFKAIRGQG